MKPLLSLALLFSVIVAIRADAVQQAGNDTVTLTAGVATINGSTLFLEGEDEQDLGNWSNPAEYPSWTINVATPGQYRVEMVYSASSDCGSSNTLELTTGTQTLDFHPVPSGDWSHYRRVKVGEITLTEKGHLDVSLKCTTKTGAFVMNLRKIILMPTASASTAEDMVPPIKATQGQAIVLTPSTAGVNGSAIALQQDGSFGSWSSLDTSFYWPVNFPAGHYHVSWEYSLDPSNVGTEIQVSVGDAGKLRVTPSATTDWATYQTADVGGISIGNSDITSGPLTVTVKATKQGASFVMNLKSLTFTPDK